MGTDWPVGFRRAVVALMVFMLPFNPGHGGVAWPQTSPSSLDAAASALRRSPVYADPTAERALSDSEAEQLASPIRDEGAPVFDETGMPFYAGGAPFYGGGWFSGGYGGGGLFGGLLLGSMLGGFGPLSGWGGDHIEINDYGDDDRSGRGDGWGGGDGWGDGIGGGGWGGGGGGDWGGGGDVGGGDW